MLKLNNYIEYLAIPAAIVGGVALVWALTAIGIRYGLNRWQRGAVPVNGRVSCRAQTCLSLLNRYDSYLKFYKISLIVAPLLIIAAYVATRYLGFADGQILELVSLAILGGMLTAYLVFRLARMIGQRDLTRLVHEGRLETRRVLDQMLDNDYIVFHDVVSEQFSIDHLVAGPKGVFAIQTHARPRRVSKQDLDSHIVTYNGRELFFPKGSDHGIVENARQNAEMLSHWLSGQTNEPVAVRAIISFPGWTVKRTSSEGIPVINPKQFSSLFEHIQPWQVSSSAMDNLARNLVQAQEPLD